MTAADFVHALGAENDALLGRLAPDATLVPEVDGALNVPNLLKVALKNEVEATEIAARWLVAALTFQLGADIVATSFAPTWDELGRLAFVAAIRTFLSVFLDREIERAAQAA